MLLDVSVVNSSDRGEVLPSPVLVDIGRRFLRPDFLYSADLANVSRFDVAARTGLAGVEGLVPF